MPTPVPVPAGTGVPFLDNASMPVWQVSWPGADQVAHGLIHRTIFVGRGNNARSVEVAAIGTINSIVWMPLRHWRGKPEGSCCIGRALLTFLHICKCTCDISNRVTLLNAQGGAVSAVPSQEQPSQIRHLAAEKREQFRIRAMLGGKALLGWENPDIRSGHGHPSKL